MPALFKNTFAKKKSEKKAILFQNWPKEIITKITQIKKAE
jgi:hypothetical protein